MHFPSADEVRGDPLFLLQAGRTAPCRARYSSSKSVMLRASVRIVCRPSPSCSASPGARPWILFQYWLDATGMPEMVKYLLSSSNVAEQPPRRAQTTLAPTFIVLSNDEI